MSDSVQRVLSNPLDFVTFICPKRKTSTFMENKRYENLVWDSSQTDTELKTELQRLRNKIRLNEILKKMRENKTCMCKPHDEDRDHVLSVNNSNRFLFSSVDQFCKAFFHAQRCYEFKIDDTLCLKNYNINRTSMIRRVDRSDYCHRRGAFIVACVSIPNKPNAFVKRYTNCYRGNTNLNLHAEDFFVSDEEVLNVLESGIDVKVVLYVTFQPCHKSGGDETFGKTKIHAKSCTNTLINFVTQYQNLTLEVICVNIYRAQYTERKGFRSEESAELFSERVCLARQGIYLLSQCERVTLRAMSREDWLFMNKLVRRKGRRVFTIPAELMRIRESVDLCVQQCIDSCICD